MLLSRVASTDLASSGFVARRDALPVPLFRFLRLREGVPPYFCDWVGHCYSDKYLVSTPDRDIRSRHFRIERWIRLRVGTLQTPSPVEPVDANPTRPNVQDVPLVSTRRC